MNLAGAALLAPMNAPGGVRGTPGLQPSGPPIFIGRYVIVFGTNGGVFLYSGTPGLGNPPILWETLGTVDPYLNPLTPGVFLAETAAAGNAKGGITWNTATPGAAEPILTLYPNATVGFTGNAPFVLGRVFNRGAVNELLALALGGGGTAGSSPVQLELFSQSKDGTILGHVSFFDWASTNLICDINVNGIVAADPNAPNALETWHLMLISGTGLTAGTPAPHVKLYPDNTVGIYGEINATSGTTSGNFCLLGSGYHPPNTKKWAVPISAGTPAATANAQVTISSGGTMTLSGGPTGAAYSFSLDMIRFPLDQ